MQLHQHHCHSLLVNHLQLGETSTILLEDMFPMLQNSGDVEGRGRSRGGSLGSNEPPFLLIHSFDLLVLYYSQQCSTLSAGVPVQFGYCLVNLLCAIQRACSEVICSIFLRVELASA